MKKYLVKAIWYKKASGSCRSYVGKKGTEIIYERETLEEAEYWANELKLNNNPYKFYENIEIIEVK